MGEAIITRRGGASSNVFAVIGAVYPSGSTCTCTKGTKTLTAKDTSGSYMFLIPEAGTWTVSCTDGTSTKSQNVVIQSQYQVEYVVLAYEYVLFENGVTSVPFEILHRDNTSITVRTNITFNGRDPAGSYSGASYRTVNTVPKSAYTKLCIKGTVSVSGIYLSYGAKLSQYAEGNENASNVSLTRSSNEKTYQLDISSFSTAQYINVCGKGNGVFSKIWLE